MTPPMLRNIVTNLAIGMATCAGLAQALAQTPAPMPLPPISPQTPNGYEKIELASKGGGGALIAAYLRRPLRVEPAPVVVSLHGCGGIFTDQGALTRRDIDWSDRFAAAGYAVLLVDSFSPRGFRQVCTVKEAERGIRPPGRAQDAAAAISWIAGQTFLDKTRIALVGWSHGGSTVLWSIDRRLQLEGAGIKTAIAFYPGCRVPAESTVWAPRVPLTILIGDADDWTRPEHCRALVARHPAIRFIEYPGAVHGFDAPDSKRRTLKGLGLVGEAQVGTDPKARAAAIAEVERILQAAFK